MSIDVMCRDKVQGETTCKQYVSKVVAFRKGVLRENAPRESGAVLVLSLLLLMVLTMLAVMAMNGSRFAYSIHPYY